ncbi:MAG: hypothetical protein WD696_01665 [Bryobacteraceae bacterium]
MKLGTNEPKKVAALAVLGILAAYLFYTNVLSSPDPGPSGQASSVAVSTRPPVSQRAPAGVRPVRTNRRSGVQEFRPSLTPRRGEERPDLTQIDPTLRLDLLAAAQSVNREGGGRNLFQFSTPPAPPAPKEPEPKIIPKTPEQIAAEKASLAKAAEPAKPPPPPIGLKFYGYSSPRLSGKRRAFFLDGDEIHVAEEGQTVKKRYKLIRIGVNSVVMEDVESKHQQTLPLQEETTG